MSLSEAALAELDALLAPEGHDKWQRFYADRTRPCPFFGLAPDENLQEWIRDALVAPGTALDPGCGNGRNAIFLARNGFAVQAVDHSASAAAWAEEEVAKARVSLPIRCCSVFDLQLAPGSVDFVYDAGCFHHIAPHRRHGYVQRVADVLAPGGVFGLLCFAPEGGSGFSDDEVYERRSLGGGLGYDEARLRAIWSDGFEIVSLRRMREQDAGSGWFGKSFLWVLRARKRPGAGARGALRRESRPGSTP